jgi:hypothetical protein
MAAQKRKTVMSTKKNPSALSTGQAPLEIQDTVSNGTNGNNNAVGSLPVEKFSGMSIEALIATLTNPESRTHVTSQLDERIATRKAELTQLEAARRALSSSHIEVTPQPPKKESKRSSGTTSRVVGRPPGQHTTPHGDVILAVLKGEKNGLDQNGIRGKMVEAGHNMEATNLASYLWNMVNSGKLVKEGPRGQFKYKIAV